MRKYFIALLMTAFFQTPLFADGGQVINVNQSYQIAFVDLGSGILKQGDVVKVLVGGSDDFIYMQVLESSSILSKLGPVQSDNFKTSLKDISRIAVGNPVVKVNPALEEKAAAQPFTVPATVSVQPTPVAPAVNTAAATAEIERLKKELADSKAQIGQLKARLENMNRILNQNSRM
jgi:hypothetical protein